MTIVAAFTYPWDILGDPAAAGRLRELGADTAILAAAYHSTTALTPRHPGHKVFQAPHSAVYFPPAPSRWAGSALQPATQDWCGTPDAYGQCAAQLRDAGPGCRVVLHADPVPYRTGANPGVLPADVLAVADGLVVPAGAVPALLTETGPLPPGTVLAANHQIVSAMGGNPDVRPPAGATEIRLYHPGLATGRDLQIAATAVDRFRAALP